MSTYIARRLVYAALTFLGITVATFVLIHSVPGDPVALYSGKMNASPAVLDAIRREHHLAQRLGLVSDHTHKPSPRTRAARRSDRPTSI